MKGGKSKVMCEQGHLYRVTKSKDGIAAVVVTDFLNGAQPEVWA